MKEKPPPVPFFSVFYPLEVACDTIRGIPISLVKEKIDFIENNFTGKNKYIVEDGNLVSVRIAVSKEIQETRKTLLKVNMSPEASHEERERRATERCQKILRVEDILAIASFAKGIVMEAEKRRGIALS